MSDALTDRPGNQREEPSVLYIRYWCHLIQAGWTAEEERSHRTGTTKQPTYYQPGMENAIWRR